MIEGTRGDSLSIRHTGAAADGDAQADPGASLGGYCSSSRAGGLGYLQTSPIANLRIEYISGANDIGYGALTAASADSLRWTAPVESGGTDGPATPIANGETRVLEDGTDPGKFAIVTRTSAADLAGGATVKTTAVLNDVIGQSDDEVLGGVTYRCIGFRAGSAVISNLKIWIAANEHPTQIALETPASEPAGAVQTIANETTAPTGLSFVAPTSASDPDVIEVSDLQAGEWVALWCRRDFSSTAAAAARAELSIDYSYTATG